MFRLQESHSEKDKFGFNDLGLALLYHDGATTIGIGLPVDFLYFHTRQSSILTNKLEGIDVPTTRTTLLMRRSGLQGTGIVWPRILGIDRSLYGLGHNLNLCDTLTPLTMGCADTI